MSVRSIVRLGLVLGLVFAAQPSAAAVDPAVKCQIQRLKMAAKYASCLPSADAKALASGGEADHASCDTKFQEKWSNLEAKSGGACLETNPRAVVQDILTTCTEDALVPPASYDIVFRLTAASAPVGTLLFNVDYGSSDGAIPGAGALVSCNNVLPGALFAPDNDEMADELLVGHVIAPAVAAPADLVSCVFDRALPGLPAAGDFTITVDTALDGDDNLITAAVAIDSITLRP